MYEELLKQLRNRRVCVQYGGDLGQDYPLMREAADAIEELIAWHNADVRELGRQKILIADMRPVVLCKDCKHSAIDLENMRYCKCVTYYNHVQDDWFCADGEKREES